MCDNSEIRLCERCGAISKKGPLCTKCFKHIYEYKKCGGCKISKPFKKAANYAVCFVCHTENLDKVINICVICNMRFESENKFIGGCDKCWNIYEEKLYIQTEDSTIETKNINYDNRNLIVYKNQINNILLEKIPIIEITNLILQYLGNINYVRVI
jgi:hypothetical protein